MLNGESKVYKNGKAATLYLSIPSKMALDSSFPLKDRDVITLEWDRKRRALVVRKKE